jgi:hypothetical protein
MLIRSESNWHSSTSSSALAAGAVAVAMRSADHYAGMLDLRNAASVRYAKAAAAVCARCGELP